MQFSNISKAARFTVFSAAILYAGSAQAGELYGNTQRLRQNQQSITPRRIYQSTRADQMLQRNRSNYNTQILGFQQSSPYEQRIVAYEKSLQKYQLDYARWQTNVRQLELRDQQRKERDRVNQESRLRTQRDREQRLAMKEQARLARLRGSDGKGGSIFSRAFGGSSSEPRGIQDEKQKKAESFFGSVEESGPSPAEQQPKPSFWQRLKRAMFGG